MRILINGICGHMGQEVMKLALNGYRGCELSAGMDPNCAGKELPVPVVPEFAQLSSCCELSRIDCIVDFSFHTGTEKLLQFAVEQKIPCVIATTGHTEEEMALIRDASEKIPVFFSANYSMGIALLTEFAKKAAAAMPDAEIEIIEKHHDRKMDAPSGTALSIAKAIQEVRPEAVIAAGRSGFGKRTPEEIGIHAVRMGNIVGVHEVMIGTGNQTIVLTHEAHSRALFAEGALIAAEFLKGRNPGFYSMPDLLKF